MAAAACGALISTGIVLFVYSFLGHEIFPNRERTLGGPVSKGVEFDWRRVLAAVIGAGLAYAIVVHPLFAVLTGISTYVVWGQLGSKRRTEAALAKENAAVVWMETLAGSLSHSPITTAIAAAAKYAEPEIKEAALRLQKNVEQTGDIPGSMARFANEMESRYIDQVAAVLALTSQFGGAQVGDLIRAEAAGARLRAASIAEIAQEQSNDRISVRQVLGVTIVMTVGLRFMSKNMLAWYDTASGYLALLLIGSAFVGCVWYVIDLAKIPPPPRFFFGDDAVDATGSDREQVSG